MLQARDNFEVMDGTCDTKFVSHIKRHVQWTPLAYKNDFDQLLYLLIFEDWTLIYRSIKLIYIYNSHTCIMSMTNLEECTNVIPGESR